MKAVTFASAISTALALSEALFAQTPAPPQWKLITPPKPGAITSFGVGATNPDQLYVTTDPDGTWSSNDGGTTNLQWQDIGMGLFEIHSTRALIPSASLRYVMDVSGGVQKSLNSGQTWCLEGFAGGIYHNLRPWTALAVDPSDSSKLLAGGRGTISGNAINSANCPTQCCPTCSGAPIWCYANGVPSDVLVTDIEFVSGGSGGVVWASTADCPVYEPFECASNFAGVLVSGDSGLNWFTVPISSTPGDLRNNVYHLATIPGQDGYLLAATADGLWGTVNFGVTWTDYTPPGLTNRKITDVVFSSSPVATVYAGTTQGVYHGTVGGGTINWTTNPFGPLLFVTSLGGSNSISNRLYMGYKTGEIYKTADYGANVQRIFGAHGGYPIASIAIKSNDDQTAYWGTVCHQGIFKGTIPTPTTPSWNVLDHPNPGNHHFHYVMRVAQNPNEPDKVYATEDDQFWLSSNGGTNWAETFHAQYHQNPPNDVHYHVHGIGVSTSILPPNPATIYIGSGHGIWGTAQPMKHVWKNANGGVVGSWVDQGANLPSLPSDTSLYDIAVHPGNPNVVYIATFGSENFPGAPSNPSNPIFGGTGMGVLRTLDGGQTWALINTGLNTVDSKFVGRVAMIVRAGTLHTYIATLDSIYRMSGAAGSTWVDIWPGTDRFESIAIDPVNGTLYAGTSEPLNSGSGSPARIYRSTNGGASWVSMPIQMQPLTWSAQYRVRDIQIGGTRAYAAVEGSGMYMLSGPDLVPVQRISP